jgi:hypothetical protein
MKREDALDALKGARASVTRTERKTYMGSTRSALVVGIAWTRLHRDLVRPDAPHTYVHPGYKWAGSLEMIVDPGRGIFAFGDKGTKTLYLADVAISNAVSCVMSALADGIDELTALHFVEQQWAAYNEGRIP